MNMISRKLIVVLLAVILFTSACGQGDMSSVESQSSSNKSETTGDVSQPKEPQEGESDSTQPNAEEVAGQEDVEIRTFDASTIEITLDENFATKEIIGAEGGSFSVTDANGIEYTLVIPEGALLYDEEISMTPIANINGEVISEVFQAGVKLEPEGLYFLELVSIEINDPAIEEGAVGFSTQSGGDNFHLIPSTSTEGRLVITTTHFTEFGITTEMVEDIKGIGELAGAIWLEHQLAKGSTEAKMAALGSMLDEIIQTGEQGIDVKNWNSWTVDVVSLLLRIDEVTSKNKWDENTAGFDEVIARLQNLVDLWFQASESVAKDIREKCIQGEIEFLAIINQMSEVSNLLGSSITKEKPNYVRSWLQASSACNHFGVSWQANVVTTASGFISDISLGAENDYWIDEITSAFSAPLEIEYIEGFWHDTCEPKEGVIELEAYVRQFEKNFSRSPANIGYIEGMYVFVNIKEPVFIDCGQGLIFNAQAQLPFHGEALKRLNQHRMESNGKWLFEIEYKPGGGMIGQFEEGPLPLDGGEVDYNLWQLVTFFQPTPVD